MLKPGAKAPDFILKSDEEKFVSLQDLFFFPKANTPG
jgi:peroxiredoxin